MHSKLIENQYCHCCGSNAFSYTEVLWPELISGWKLSQKEVDYINRQQGECCLTCGGNLRSICLAFAILRYFNFDLTFEKFTNKRIWKKQCVLEINEAGNLTRWLKKTKKYIFGSYPEVDMMNMSFPNNYFDLVIHSDTLEHIKDPLLGLRECFRITKPGGAVIFTVPIILGRLTKSCLNDPPTYHGSSESMIEDLRVHTEFGSDAWCMAIESGFKSVEMITYKYPSGVAMLLRKI